MNAIIPISPRRTLTEYCQRPRKQPKPDNSAIIFLAAFIGTSYPLQRLQVGNNVIPFPYAYPRETIYLLNRSRRSQVCKTEKITYLPAPKTPEYGVKIGDVIHVLYNHDQCKIERIFDQFDDIWVQMRHPYGVITRRLSQLIPNTEA